MSQTTVSKRWKTDPEYTDLLNYLIEKTKDAKSPIKIPQLVRDFKEKSGVEQTERCLAERIRRMCAYIHSFEHIEMETKLRMLYALGASINGDFLQELINNAHVEIDENNRITHYKSERLELSTPGASTSYWKTDREGIELLNYLIKKTENVKCPLNVSQLARDFKEHNGTSQTADSLQQRIKRISTIIHNFVHIDKNTKVKLLFALSAPVNADFLEQLKEHAFVEVDKKYRITYYEAIIDGLELSGDHSQSMKLKNAQLESEWSHQSMINSYFENKDDVNAVPTNEEEKEMWYLIKLITEKCANVTYPLNLTRLTEDFNNHFDTSKQIRSIRRSVESYCRAIQKVDFLDPVSKVKQLFGLSATIDPDYLEKLRKKAVVDVDSQNRIIEYTSNDGRLNLDWGHWGSRLAPSQYIDRINNSKRVLTGSDVDDEEYHGSIDFTTRSPPTFKTPKKAKSTSNYNPVHSFHDQPRFELQKFPGSMQELLDDDQIKLEPFRGSIQEDMKGIEEDEDIQQIPKPPPVLDEHNQMEKVTIKEELEEPVEDSTEPLEVKPVQKLGEDNQIEEVLIKEEHEDPIEVKPVQTFDTCNELTGVPIKVEQKEPVEVKRETYHNSKIKFFEAMQSLILCLDNPSLSSIQSKIHQNIQKLKESDEVILNSEVVLVIESLISRMNNHSVVNLSKNVESVNLSNFLCYLKATILNSKLIGADGLVKNINEAIEESQNKRIPMEKVANALRATLDIDGF